MMVGFHRGPVRVDVADTTVRIMKDTGEVWLTLDELRWLVTTAGPAAAKQLEHQMAARGHPHMGAGTSPAPEP